MNSVRSRLKTALKSIATVDLRSLALFRICIGFLTLVDLLDRAPDLRTYYTDFGVLPRFALLDHFDDGRLLVLHLLGGSTGFQLLLFAVHFLCAFAFLVGYRTRIANFLIWIFALSLVGRQPQVAYAADVLVRLLLLWGLFLPLGARWSVDRALNLTEPRGSNRYCSLAVIGLLLQIVSVYFFTAVAKYHDLSWQRGLGVYYAVMMESYATPIGGWLSHQAAFLRWSNYGVVFFEGFGWLLLFVPWRRNFLRLPLFFAFFLFHVGMGLGLYVTFFQAAAICGWTSTLPSSFWILLQKRWKTGARKLFLLRTRVIQSLRRDYAVRNTPLRFSHGKLVQAIALIIIVQCFLWNTHTMFPDEMPMAPEVSSVTFMFGLDQTWGMFAHPFHRSGWFVVPGKLADGSDVDLFRDGAPLSWEKPENISGMYRDERNRKYMMNLLERDRDPSKWQLGAYYCRAWNAEHPDPSKKLEAFKIIYRRAEILYDGNLGPVSSEMLWQHQCSNGLLDKWGAKISEGP